MALNGLFHPALFYLVKRKFTKIIRFKYTKQLIEPSHVYLEKYAGRKEVSLKTEAEMKCSGGKSEGISLINRMLGHLEQMPLIF